MGGRGLESGRNQGQMIAWRARVHEFSPPPNSWYIANIMRTGMSGQAVRAILNQSCSNSAKCPVSSPLLPRSRQFVGFRPARHHRPNCGATRRACAATASVPFVPHGVDTPHGTGSNGDADLSTPVQFGRSIRAKHPAQIPAATDRLGRPAGTGHSARRMVPTSPPQTACHVLRRLHKNGFDDLRADARRVPMVIAKAPKSVQEQIAPGSCRVVDIPTATCRSRSWAPVCARTSRRNARCMVPRARNATPHSQPNGCGSKFHRSETRRRPQQSRLQNTLCTAAAPTGSCWMGAAPGTTVGVRPRTRSTCCQRLHASEGVPRTQ